MHLLNPSLPFLAGGCLLLGMALALLCTRRGLRERKRSFVEVSPRYRSFFRHQRLIDADVFAGELGR